MSDLPYFIENRHLLIVHADLIDIYLSPLLRLRNIRTWRRDAELSQRPRLPAIDAPVQAHQIVQLQTPLACTIIDTER